MNPQYSLLCGGISADYFYLKVETNVYFDLVLKQYWMGRRSLDKLNNQVLELETRIENMELKIDSVSSSSIGWHLEHSCLVINGVIDVIKTSDPSEFKRKFNFPKLYCFTMKKFPRGKVKAPKAVSPEENTDRNRLEEHLKITQENVRKLSTLGKAQFFRHKIFGDLQLNDTIRFLELHTGHHLKIVGEISSPG
jgi:hypothetical protein